jgi:hypothetical protein
MGLPLVRRAPQCFPEVIHKTYATAAYNREAGFAYETTLPGLGRFHPMY